jgi:hypothetical protein
MNVINALLALPARPITSLPVPPLGAPEFGVAIAPSPSPSTMQSRLVRLRARHASLKRFAIATAQEPPSIATVQMAVLAPALLPPPQRPAVWLNQPNPVPLPEPGAVGFPGPESPTIAPPQDEDDDQPIAWLHGAGSFSDTHAQLSRTCAFDRTASSGWLSFVELAPSF